MSYDGAIRDYVARSVNLGEFEAAALRRERDELWRNRLHLSEYEGRRLDYLLAKVGRPDDQPHQHRTPADRQGFAPFEYEERN